VSSGLTTGPGDLLAVGAPPELPPGGAADAGEVAPELPPAGEPAELR
jgi:hypothetical protein